MLKNENTPFEIASDRQFLEWSLQLFRRQYERNAVYGEWVRLLGVNADKVSALEQIPFMPIGFFKTHEVVTAGREGDAQVFTSSGTTGQVASRHIVTDIGVYEQSYLSGFRLFYGEPSDYCVLALLPGYLERKGSSLVYMVNGLIQMSRHPDSGFYLNNMDDLVLKINKLKNSGQKVLLIGVTYALLDLCETGVRLGENFTVIETGGMKGTRREMLKQELHQTLRNGLGVEKIHSEYGMTELLSQAYSRGDGLFEPPPWMRFLIREVDDPFRIKHDQRTGGINVIDLANLNSCAFIATQDLGKLTADNKLELMGRFDDSDIRGCNLMVQ